MQQLVMSVELQGTYHLVSIDLANGNTITFQRALPNKPIDIISMDQDPLIGDQASLIVFFEEPNP